MNVSRRWFIGGMASVGAARILRAAPGMFSAGTPNMRFGLVTDIHLAIAQGKDGFVFRGEETFRRTLEWFRGKGVDGVVICGDMADFGLVEELDAVARAWYSVFPDDKGPDGRRVEKLFVYGNHDWEGFRYGDMTKKLFGEKNYDHAINKDLAAAWRRSFHEDYAPIWRKDVKGYSFVGAHWIADRCRASEEVGVPQTFDWFAANGKSLDPTKPFFYMQHPTPKGTCHGDWVWGQDVGKSTEALSAFRNAVALSGHSHASITDERAIWQGAFTSIGAGSLKYTGVTYGDVAPFGRENDNPMNSQRGEDPYKVMGRIDTGDGHQGILVSVYDDRIVYDRRDCVDFTSLGDEWVMPTPLAEPLPFAFASRAASSVAPEFSEGASLGVRITTGKNRGGKAIPREEQSVLEVTIPPACAVPGRHAFDYALKITDEKGGRDDKYVFATGFHRSASSDKAKGPTVCLLPVRRLHVSGKLRIEVAPRNSFGKAGKSMLAEFDMARK